MNLLAAEFDIVVPYAFEIPTWAAVAALVAVAVVALIVWRATRRKGPPPLPRP